MISIKELRIDNWVRIMEPDKYAGTVGKIQTLSSLKGSYFTINISDSNFGYLHADVFCEDLEPIPLTAEILEKNEFVYTEPETMTMSEDKVWQVNDDDNQVLIEIEEQMDENLLDYYIGHFTSGANSCEIYFRNIHQLQNILIDLGIDKEIIL